MRFAARSALTRGLGETIAGSVHCASRHLTEEGVVCSTPLRGWSLHASSKLGKFNQQQVNKLIFYGKSNLFESTGDSLNKYEVFTEEVVNTVVGGYNEVFMT